MVYMRGTLVPEHLSSLVPCGVDLGRLVGSRRSLTKRDSLDRRKDMGTMKRQSQVAVRTVMFVCLLSLLLAPLSAMAQNVGGAITGYSLSGRERSVTGHGASA